jgi:hypothetical protein
MQLALFDFDGTITDREMFIPFLQHTLPSWRRALGSMAQDRELLELARTRTCRWQPQSA